MNATNFENWFQEKLLPALPANILIMMDNASYHRYRMCEAYHYLIVQLCFSHHLKEQPKQKWRKAQMKE